MKSPRVHEFLGQVLSLLPGLQTLVIQDGIDIGQDAAKLFDIIYSCPHLSEVHLRFAFICGTTQYLLLDISRWKHFEPKTISVQNLLISKYQEHYTAAIVASLAEMQVEVKKVSIINVTEGWSWWKSTFRGLQDLYTCLPFPLAMGSSESDPHAAFNNFLAYHPAILCITSTNMCDFDPQLWHSFPPIPTLLELCRDSGWKVDEASFSRKSVDLPFTCTGLTVLYSSREDQAEFEQLNITYPELKALTIEQSRTTLDFAPYVWLLDDYVCHPSV
jgi:hypothetical protein